MAKDNRSDIRKPPISTKTSPNSWLDQWPRDRRNSLAGLFHSAVRRGCTVPGTVVAHVEHQLTNKLHEVSNQVQRFHFKVELEALRTDQGGINYAESILQNGQSLEDQKSGKSIEHSSTF